jgi:NAD/NADP transhydrogenase alpha subunit
LTRLCGGVVSGAAYDYTEQVTGQVDPAAVPEPASLTVLGMGVAGIASVRRRRVG